MPAASTELSNIVDPSHDDTTSRKVGILARVARAFIEARQRQVEREVGLIIEAGGGRLTDTVERRIERHFV